MSTIIKPLGTEQSISSANTVANSNLVRVTYTGGTSSVLTFANSGGTYANLTIMSSLPTVIVTKQSSDTLQGTSLIAVPIAYRN